MNGEMRYRFFALRAIDDNGDNITELYVSRNGYSLPANDLENSMKN